MMDFHPWAIFEESVFDKTPKLPHVGPHKTVALIADDYFQGLQAPSKPSIILQLQYIKQPDQTKMLVTSDRSLVKKLWTH
jgi:hypothetical protein